MIVLEFLREYADIFGYVFGILGIVLSFYYGIKSKKISRLGFDNKGFTLFDTNNKLIITDIKVLIEDKPIEYLSVNLITVWNSGDNTINSHDIAPKDRVRISTFDNIILYNIDIAHSSNNTNGFRIEFIDGVYYLEFDYMDKNDGCVLRIFSNSKKTSAIYMSGTLKGMGTIERSFKKYPLSKYFAPWVNFRKTRDIVRYFFTAMLVLCIVIFVSKCVNSMIEGKEISCLFLTMISIMIVLMTLSIILIKRIKPSVPRNLDNFIFNNVI